MIFRNHCSLSPYTYPPLITQFTMGQLSKIIISPFIFCDWVKVTECYFVCAASIILITSIVSWETISFQLLAIFMRLPIKVSLLTLAKGGHMTVARSIRLQNLILEQNGIRTEKWVCLFLWLNPEKAVHYYLNGEACYFGQGNLLSEAQKLGDN